MAFGSYPEISLATARQKRLEARELVAQGIDPAEAKREKSIREQETFELIAREWHTRFSPNGEQKTGEKILALALHGNESR